MTYRIRPIISPDCRLSNQPPPTLKAGPAFTMAPFSDRISRKVDRRPQSPSRLRSVSTTAVVGVGDKRDIQRESVRRDGRTQEDRQRRGQSLNIDPARGSDDADVHPPRLVSVPLSGPGDRTNTGVRRAGEEAWRQERIPSHLSSMRDIESAQNLLRFPFLSNDDDAVEPSMPSASARGGAYSDDDMFAEYDDGNYYIPSRRERRRSRRPSPNHGTSSAHQAQQHPEDNRGQSTSARRSSNVGSGTCPGGILHPRFGTRTPPYAPERTRTPGSSPGYVDYADRGAQTEAWPHYYHRRSAAVPDSDSRGSRVPRSHASQDAVLSRSSSSRQSRKNSGSGSGSSGAGPGIYAPPRQPSYRVVITPEYEIDGNGAAAIDDYTSDQIYYSGGHESYRRLLPLHHRHRHEEDERVRESRHERKRERERRHSQRTRTTDSERDDESHLNRHRSRSRSQQARYTRENEERVVGGRGRRRRRHKVNYDDDGDDDDGYDRRRKARPVNVFRGNWCLFGRDRR